MAEKKVKEPVEEDSNLGNVKPVEDAKVGGEKNNVVELINRLNLRELTSYESAYWRESQLRPYNPDDLVQRRMDYSIYEAMALDDQINICLKLKKDLVMGAGYEFVCEDEAESDIAMKEALEVAFDEDIETDFEQSLEEILSAYEMGFSLSEIVWKVNDAGHYVPKSIKTRHPSSWLLHTDAQGNVIRYEQRDQKTSYAVPPNALIHYIHNSNYGNPYGRSDLRAAYNAWFIKQELIKYYAIFFEKYASPTAVGKYKSNMPPAAVDALFEALKKLQSRSAMTIPDSVELDFLQSSSNGDVYVKGVHLFNMIIGRALFIPDLLGFQGGETGGGSQALGKEQMLVFFKHIDKLKRQAEKLVNRRLVKPFVLNNYGPQEKYPKFRFKELSDEKAIELAKVWLEAVKGRLYKPSDEEIDHFRSLMRMPQGEIERYEDTAQEGFEESDDDGNLDANGKPKDDSKKAEGDDKPDPKSKDEPEKKGEEKNTKNFSKVFDETPGSYSKKVNFKLAKNSMVQTLSKVMNECQPLIRELYDDLFRQIRDKKILAAQDIEKISDLKLKNLSKIKKVLKSQLANLNKDGKKQAASELLSGAQYASPLPSDEFMNFLEQELFTYVGDWEYTIKKQTRIALIEAIKDGKSLTSVLDVLDDEGVALSEESLERYARTKSTEVYNRGRQEFFESTGVVSAYQFSAVIDDRVSDVCEGLHGKIFDAGKEPIPPLHFNCRSILIPITKYEEYKPDKTVEVDGKNVNIDTFIDDNKGKGFSRQ